MARATAKQFEGDHVAAAIHRERAERHYQAAERFRKLRMPASQAAALRAARSEDSIAELLAYGRMR